MRSSGSRGAPVRAATYTSIVLATLALTACAMGAREAPRAADEAARQAPAVQGAEAHDPAQQAVARPAHAEEAAPVAPRPVARAKDGPWDVVREFPAPDYALATGDEVRTDLRDTIFWAPSIRTGRDGVATVSFYASDAITSFRATVAGLGGGAAGRADAVFASARPISAALTMPTGAAVGDTVLLPVSVTNTTDEALRASVMVTTGPSLIAASPDADAPLEIWLDPGQTRTIHHRLAAAAHTRRDADGSVAVEIVAGAHRDRLERTLAVYPAGFPAERGLAGELPADGDVGVVEIAHDAHPASIEGEVTLYPGAVSAALGGLASLLREPSGCFEQTSSTNYPNVLALDYLRTTGDALSPELAERVRGMLDIGYKKLTGFRSAGGGYEWFGGNPGHEALTAYGLMQFVAMARVYDVDPAVIDGTRAWLLSRRDGDGGFERSDNALDTFGRADDAVTDAYITWALTEAGVTDLPAELDALASNAGESADPYLLALAANALHHARDPRAPGLLDTLLAMAGRDGGLPAGRQTITLSGGVSARVEVNALALMAAMRDGRPAHLDAAEALHTWLLEQRSGGRFGATQSTVLALQALLLRARSGGATPAGTRFAVAVDGEVVGDLRVEASVREPLRVPLPALSPGRHRVTLTHAPPPAHPAAARSPYDEPPPEPSRAVALPYDVRVRWHGAAPPDDPAAAIGVTTSLDRSRVGVGEPVRLTAVVTNLRREGQPMVIARVGIPGGAATQTWQLDGLVERGVIAFYETRPREVVLYWRDMAPDTEVIVPIDLLAQVPGTYTASPSAAYLYYTDEHRRFAAPLSLAIDPPTLATREQ